MKIKNITDVITNSSSEVYLVKTTIDTSICKELFIELNKKLDKEMYNNYKDSYLIDSTMGNPRITRIDEESVEFGWDILCNLYYADETLEQIFGKENVRYVGY